MRWAAWSWSVASAVVVAIGCAVCLLGGARAAEAYFGAPSTPSNYHSYVVSVTPAVPAVSVRTLDHGNWVVASNPTSTVLTVYGYSHLEPGPKDQYLRISRDGVWVNVKSPAYYLDRTLYGTSVPPEGATDVDATPVWKKISDASTYRWHDHRAHWASPEPPPQVQAAPGEHHGIFPGNDIYFKYGDTNFIVVVAMDWVPENPAYWWIVVVVGFVAVVALVGFLRSWRRASLGVLGALAVVSIGQVAVSAYSPASSRGGLVLSLASAIVPAIAIVGLCVLAMRSVVRRRGSAYWLMGAAGVLAAIQGSSDVSVIWSSQLPQSGPGWLVRVVIGLAVGLGAGLLVAALLRAWREKTDTRLVADPTSRAAGKCV